MPSSSDDRNLKTANGQEIRIINNELNAFGSSSHEPRFPTVSKPVKLGQRLPKKNLKWPDLENGQVRVQEKFMPITDVESGQRPVIYLEIQNDWVRIHKAVKTIEALQANIKAK